MQKSIEQQKEKNARELREKEAEQKKKELETKENERRALNPRKKILLGYDM